MIISKIFLKTAPAPQIPDILHYATNSKHCFDGTCRNFYKYYNEHDATTDQTIASGCAYYFFKHPNKVVKDTYNQVIVTENDKINKSWGDCMIFDTAYKKHDLGFKDSDNQRRRNSFLQVGIASCHNGSFVHSWSPYSEGRNFFIVKKL